MKPIIPKIPEVLKEFSDKEIYFLTKSFFGEIIEPQPCDVLFVFSGTHPGHWKKDIKAYQKGYVKKNPRHWRSESDWDSSPRLERAD